MVHGARCSGADLKYYSIVCSHIFPAYTYFLISYRSVNVIKARRAKGDKSRYALVGLIPFAITWTLIPAYLYLNPDILHNHLVPFAFFCGLINAYSVGQIITAHLVKLDFPYYNVLILPLAYGVFDSLGPFLQQNFGFGWPSALGDGGYQVAYMFMMLGAGIGVYGSFVVSIASYHQATESLL